MMSEDKILAPSPSGVPADTVRLTDQLEKIIGGLANFRNSLDSTRRGNLLSALRRMQQEADVRDIRSEVGHDAIAAAMKGLDTACAVAEAIGLREIPGSGPYEACDRRWLEVLPHYAFDRRVAFPTHQSLNVDPVGSIEEADPIKIALVGDWGTGNPPAKDVAQQIAQCQPTLTIHLGDVYYCGLEHQEVENFLRDWPKGSQGSFALNSNHEMYSGGSGYFSVLLKDPRFERQQGLSYFALHSPHWLIIGLDTAYFAYHYSLFYEDGILFEMDMGKEPNGMVQLEWMRELLKQHAGKRVIMLTHHDGFDMNPATGQVSLKPLYQQMTGELTGRREWWWYWGHVHAGIAYRRIALSKNSTVTARCVGHGGIPYEPFPHNLAELGDGTVAVEWAECELAGRGGNPKRAPNGFLLITLDGSNIHEEFYDELGRKRWPT